MKIKNVVVSSLLFLAALGNSTLHAIDSGIPTTPNPTPTTYGPIPLMPTATMANYMSYLTGGTLIPPTVVRNVSRGGGDHVCFEYRIPKVNYEYNPWRIAYESLQGFLHQDRAKKAFKEDLIRQYRSEASRIESQLKDLYGVWYKYVGYTEKSSSVTIGNPIWRWDPYPEPVPGDDPSYLAQLCYTGNAMGNADLRFERE